MKKNIIFLISLFIIAFVARFGYNAIILKFETPPSSYYGADDGDYDSIGWNLASGKGYSIIPGELTADRSPGYPLFLAFIYKIFGHNYTAVRISQSLMGAFTCVLIFILASKLLNFRTALLASAIYSVYPFAIFFSGAIFTENLFIFVLLVFVLFLSDIKNQMYTYFFLTCGTLLGYLTLIKPNMFAFYPILLFWLFLVASKQIKVFIKISVLILLGSMIVIAPFIIRNAIVFKQFLFLRACAGEGLLVAHNDVVYKEFKNPIEGNFLCSPLEIEGVPEMIKGLNNVERDKVYWRLAIQYIKNNPRKTFISMYYQVWKLFNPFPHPKVKNRLFVIFSYGLILPFVPLGLLLSFKHFKNFLLIYLIILFFISNAAVFGGYSRYRQPIEPFLIIFAAYGLIYLITYVTNLKQK